MNKEENHSTSREGGSHTKVVVGIDGSNSSLRALRFAARQAQWMDAPLEVVTAWTFPEKPAPLDITINVQNLEHLMDEALAKLAEIIADEVPTHQRKHAYPRVFRGTAAKVLLAESADAQLLVVGSRGLGALEQLLLGSVSERCVRHAPCPVTVVP